MAGPVADAWRAARGEPAAEEEAPACIRSANPGETSSLALRERVASRKCGDPGEGARFAANLAANAANAGLPAGQSAANPLHGGAEPPQSVHADHQRYPGRLSRLFRPARSPN